MKHLLRSRIYPDLLPCARSRILNVEQVYACGVADVYACGALGRDALYLRASAAPRYGARE